MASNPTSGQRCVAFLSKGQLLFETLLGTALVVLFSLCGAKTYTLPAKVASAGKDPLFKKVLLVVLSVVFAIEIVYIVCSRQLLYLLNPCHVCTVLEVPHASKEYANCKINYFAWPYKPDLLIAVQALKNSLCRIEGNLFWVDDASWNDYFPSNPPPPPPRFRFLVHYIYGAAIALLFPETDSRLVRMHTLQCAPLHHLTHMCLHCTCTNTRATHVCTQYR